VSLALIAVNLVPLDMVMSAGGNAVLAVLAAEQVYLYKHRKLYGKRGQQRRMYLTVLAVLVLVLGALAPRTDLFGLLGGMAGGATLAAFISPFHLPRPHPDEPGALLGEDVNPLQTRVIPLALYVSALLSVLILGVFFMGR
jgi:hypothetical protein